MGLKWKSTLIFYLQTTIIKKKSFCFSIRTYRIIPKISPGLIFGQISFFGLIFEGAYFFLRGGLFSGIDGIIIGPSFYKKNIKLDIILTTMYAYTVDTKQLRYMYKLSDH